MNVKLTKSLAVAMLSMAAVSSAFAANNGKKGTGSSGCCVENVYGSTGCQMATGRPQIEKCGCGNWYVMGGAIYWHARVDGTEFAYSNEKRSTNNLPVKGSMKDVHYSWDWGFRVGLGYAFEHDNWDASLEFTYFDSHGSKNSSAGCNDIMYQNRAEFGMTNTTPFRGAAISKAKSDIDYYDLTLELGRAQFNTKYLYFRPHFGLKGSWTDLDQTTRFSELLTGTSSTTLDCQFVHVKDFQDWWGIGPRIGFDSKWFLGEKFNLFADASFAALFGLFDVTRRVKYSGNDAHRVRVRANKHGITPYASIFLGAAYDTYVGDNNGSHVSIRAGYEVNYFWRLNQLLRVDDSLANAQKYDRFSEDVGFHGITVEAKWEF